MTPSGACGVLKLRVTPSHGNPGLHYLPLRAATRREAFLARCYYFLGFIFLSALVDSLPKAAYQPACLGATKRFFGD